MSAPSPRYLVQRRAQRKRLVGLRQTPCESRPGRTRWKASRTLAASEMLKRIVVPGTESTTTLVAVLPTRNRAGVTRSPVTVGDVRSAGGGGGGGGGCDTTTLALADAERPVGSVTVSVAVCVPPVAKACETWL